MAVDIKDAGILAGFELWGWPWHGLCTSGSIDLGGGLTKTITTPAHGSAWLIDRALPAITRSVDQLAADAALGHQWRNYGMVSGGVVYGTALGINQYIHVDEAGERWLISLSYSFANWLLDQVRITFEVVQFGLFGEGVKTPITSAIDVQCHDITYSTYGYSYEGFESILEDVWTNGSRALVSFGRTRDSTPSLKDLFSVIEITITGTGGADGSGLVIDAVEVMQDTELSQGLPGQDTAHTYESLTPGVDWTGSDPNWSPVWTDTSFVVSNSRIGSATGGISPLSVNHLDIYTYARFAYYNSAGQVKAARIKKMFKATATPTGTTHTTAGGLVKNKINCLGEDVSAGPDFYYHHDEFYQSTTTTFEEWMFGVYLLENDTEIDSLELYQSTTITGYFGFRAVVRPIPGGSLECNDFTGPPVPGYGGTWGAVGTLYNNSPAYSTVTAPEWRGSLAGSLGLPAAPDLRDPGGWFFDVDLGVDTEPLALDDLILEWRKRSTNHQTSGSATVAGTAELGIQRIDAKAAAFYKPGATRTYGNILTPLGVKTTLLTPAGNLYFAWQRKTGDFSFSASPICYV